MNTTFTCSCLATLLFSVAGTARAEATRFSVPVKNPSFTEGVTKAGVPVGWTRYGGKGTDQRLAVVAGPDEKKALLIADGDPAAEIGVYQTFPLKAGETYRAGALVAAVPQSSPAGAYLQLRFLPSNQLVQTSLWTLATDRFREVSVTGTAPPGTTKGVLYLYTHKDPTPKVLVTGVRVEGGLPPPPPPPPPPVPPQYDKLKDLHLRIPLTTKGKPAAVVVTPAAGGYDRAAAMLQQVVHRRTGVTVPVVADTSPTAAVPAQTNLIVLGNRSTNRTMSALYDQYYSLVDLKYPGPGGYVIRTVHNPFGNGFGVVLVGGSDDAGVAEGARVLAEILAQTPNAKGGLSLGWTMRTKLGKGLNPPKDIRKFETWEASKGYGSIGYFGWCSISKRMAMYYMTGEESNAREFVRLAFPDAQALKDIEEIDGERIENKQDPLAGFYHYNAHMAILFWDLIEESPVFTDEERLKITNAFARQLNHRKGEGIYQLTTPPARVGSRHGQWAALSLYCLGRYFNKDYPSPVWAQCVRAGRLAFHSLHEHAWIAGESDNLFWYDTGIAPVLTYMVLTGDRKPLENGVLARLLRGLEILCSGRVPDWALRSASLGFLNKAAYLTGDGRWITYRKRTRVDTGLFRLGQSFWPPPALQPGLPLDLVGTWSIQPLPRPAWESRRSGLPFDQSFYFGSYRSAPGATGDFVLLDGFNGASRNPYHTFDILELRIEGRTLLKGYHNQVLTSADGMVAPKVAMDAALRFRTVVGETALAVGEVPNASFCNWRRTLCQRIGRYALLVDDLTFHSDSRNMTVKTTFQTPGGAWDPKEQVLHVAAPGAPRVLPGWIQFRALNAHCTSHPDKPGSVAVLESLGIVLLRAKQTGAWIELPFHLDTQTKGEYFVDFLDYVDRGVARAFLDGRRVGRDYDNYSAGVTKGRLPLGTLDLPPGDHRLRLQVVDNHSGTEKCYLGLAGLSIRLESTQALPTTVPGYELRSADVQEAHGGSILTLEWRGAVKKGRHRLAFYLLGKTRGGTAPLVCARLADNVAALATPRPAVAVSGAYRQSEGDLVVLAADHLFGHRLRRAGLDAPLFIAQTPVEADWDFETGVLYLESSKPTTVTLKAPADGLRLDDKEPVSRPAGDGLVSLSLSAGRHRLTGAVVSGGALTQQLSDLVATAENQREAALVSHHEPPRPTAPKRSAVFTAEVGEPVADLIFVPGNGGLCVAAAAGPRVHLFTTAGRNRGTLSADGNIRVLRWWPEARLLLVGCVDEKVIAFRQDGRRAWEFVSKMDPAVYAAAKTYWFKSAPGHEGIHGLFTGPFDHGKSRCFVGSACTLEILDMSGKLVKRTPVFWGPGRTFLLVDADGGSKNLLVSRWPNGNDHLAIVNSKTMAVVGRGYNGVPPGHSSVGGWTAQNRTRLLACDVDGDGKKEVVTAINGTWNRVTVYSQEGRPLFNAQFGPGASNAPRAQMRDLDVVDLDGDGKKELVTGISAGLVVALTHDCRKLWSTRLPSPPRSLRAVIPAGKKRPVIVVGCDDGTVAVLDSAGEVVARSAVVGRPEHMIVVAASTGPEVVLGTSRGRVAGFRF